jgi:hypothetical protein
MHLPVRAVRSDFVWLLIKKRAASYLQVWMHIFREKHHQPLVTLTLWHTDTTAQ